MSRTVQIKELRRLDAVDRDHRRDRSRKSWATDRPAARIVIRRYVGQVLATYLEMMITDNAYDERAGISPVFPSICKRWQHAAFLEQDTGL